MKAYYWNIINFSFRQLVCKDNTNESIFSHYFITNILIYTTKVHLHKHLKRLCNEITYLRNNNSIVEIQFFLQLHQFLFQCIYLSVHIWQFGDNNARFKETFNWHCR